MKNKKYYDLPNLDSFGLSLESGFLSGAQIPCNKLSNPYYEPWEHLLELLEINRLENQKEEERASMILSFIAHCYIWGALDEPAVHILPQNIAIPWVQISNKLGLFPVLTFTTSVMYNYKFITETGLWRPPKLDEVKCNLLFTGTPDEEWFYLVSLAIEGCAGKCLNLIQTALQHIDSGDDVGVSQCLAELAPVLCGFRFELDRMYEKCQPEVFFHSVRRYLTGWENMTEQLPNGVFYEGCPESDFPIGSESELEDEEAEVVSAEVQRHLTNYGKLRKTSDGLYIHPETNQRGTFRKYAGASAGQSPLIHLLDTFLCIEHQSRVDGQTLKPEMSPSQIGQALKNASGNAVPATAISKKAAEASEIGTQPIPQPEQNHRPVAAPLKKPRTNFFHEMRRYLPRKHRQYLRIIRKHRHQLRPFVKKHPDNETLLDNYNSCVNEMKEFRNFHIKMVTRYIVNPARKAQQQAGASQNLSIKQALSARGTGGTDVIPLLKSLRNETIDTLFDTNDSVTSTTDSQ